MTPEILESFFNELDIDYKIIQTINKVSDNKPAEKSELQTSEKSGAMTWAARLKRAFNIDVKICQACGGAVKVIACIEDPVIINKILNSVQSQQDSHFMLPINRAPPVGFTA